MEIRVSFPGGKRVDAAFRGHVVRTDQPVSSGGENSAPGPYDLFLASVATCAGIFILSFCQNRQIPTDGLEIIQRDVVDPTTQKLVKVELEVVLPKGFPEKYTEAVLRAADGCKVKKALIAPPQFEITATTKA